jgi:hypothetical protein
MPGRSALSAPAVPSVGVYHGPWNLDSSKGGDRVQYRYEPVCPPVLTAQVVTAVLRAETSLPQRSGESSTSFRRLAGC